MRVNNFNSIIIVLILFICEHVTCKCKFWSKSKQSEGNSLFVHFGAGRLGSRMTSYIILVIMRYNLKVDKNEPIISILGNNMAWMWQWTRQYMIL